MFKNPKKCIIRNQNAEDISIKITRETKVLYLKVNDSPVINNRAKGNPKIHIIIVGLKKLREILFFFHRRYNKIANTM